MNWVESCSWPVATLWETALENPWSTACSQTADKHEDLGNELSHESFCYGVCWWGAGAGADKLESWSACPTKLGITPCLANGEWSGLLHTPPWAICSAPHSALPTEERCMCPCLAMCRTWCLRQRLKDLGTGWHIPEVVSSAPWASDLSSVMPTFFTDELPPGGGASTLCSQSEEIGIIDLWSCWTCPECWCLQSHP